LNPLTFAKEMRKMGGGALHSIDEAVAGKEIIGDAATPQG
jgi:hypothetical protein